MNTDEKHDYAKALENIQNRRIVYNSAHMGEKPQDVVDEMNAIFDAQEDALTRCAAKKDGVKIDTLFFRKRGPIKNKGTWNGCLESLQAQGYKLVKPQPPEEV